MGLSLMVVLLSFMSVFVALDKKISDNNRTGFFIVIGVIVLLYVVFSIIL